MDGDALVVENASSVMLLTRIEYFPDYQRRQGGSRCGRRWKRISPDYPALLDRHKEFSRRCSTASPWISAAPRNMACPPRNFCPISGRGRITRPRCWRRSSKWAAIGSSSTAASIPASQPRLTPPSICKRRAPCRAICAKAWRPTSTGWRAWPPDCRTNAKNIFGFRGASYPLFPDKGVGANFYYTSTLRIGIWPYWISAGGWYARQFWDHYLVTGDLEFLRNRVVPVYKDLALFYEDFLTATDKNGNYMFVPSISPENVPAQHGPLGARADQCHHGHRGVPGSSDQSDPGFAKFWAPTPTAWRNGRRCWPRCRPTWSNRTAP